MTNINKKQNELHLGIDKIEVKLLLEGIYLRYGYDFRNYSYASLHRRIWHRIKAEKLSTISALQDKVLHDPLCMEKLLADLSINVTEMFRDPSFFYTFRTRVVPFLRTYPVVRIWHAGCSTGEEVFSMAILLKEEGLLERCKIYATDFNKEVLKQARLGQFGLNKMKQYTSNYQNAGGKRAFSEYYSANGEYASFDLDLVNNVVFAQHNLVTDGSFNEFNVILCRNVLIYFNKTLQDQIHDLFFDSLSKFGVLGLGDKESIKFKEHATKYEELVPYEKLYRKIE